MASDDAVGSRPPAGPRPGGNGSPPAQGAWSLALTQAPPGAAPLPDGYLRTDAHGVVLDADEAAGRLLLCGRAFLLGKPLGLLLADESRPPFYQFLMCPKVAGQCWVFELRLRRPGPAHDVIAMAVVAGGGAAAAEIDWQLRDITLMRHAERALRRERQLLDGIIDAAQGVILVLDAQGRVLRSNRYLHEVCGYDLPDLQARYWDEILLLPRDRQLGQRLVHEAVRHGIAHTAALAMPCRSGARREVIWSARGLPERAGAAVVVLGHDVTDLQQAQRLALHAERLAAVGQMAAGLAHESRNALQRIQACLSMLALRLRGQQDALDLLDRAQRAQDDLHHLFDDVLDYASAPRPRPAPCDLAAVWREAWADLAALPRRQGAWLMEEPAGTDLRCEADAFQLKRVFRNLFENALAAGADPVRVVVRCRPAALGSQRAVEVSVRDNGPGFPPELRRRLFEPFLTTKTHGTGLGLAICRRTVEAHGGRIEVGQEGPGAEVIITLPRRMP